MKNPLVSVIIPAYNRANLIPRAISSVLQQSYHPIEIIVVDDASTDNTKSKILNLRQNHSNISYLRLPKNRGEVAARNAGIIAAKGELLTFLDSDDELTPESIAIRVKTYLHSRYKNPLIYGSFILNGELRRFVSKSGLQYKYLMRELSLCGIVAIMVNRQALLQAGLPNEKLPSWGDDDLIVTYAKNNPLQYLDFPVANIYTSVDSVSINQTRNRQGCEMMITMYKTDILKHCGINRLILWYIRIMRLRILELKSYLLKQGGTIASLAVFIIRIIIYILDKFLYLFFDNLFV